MNKLKQKYKDQKLSAGYRNIDWQFTFEEWVTWWGDDIEKRGRYKGQLVMARIGDQGPYHPDNVRKAKTEDNVRESCIPRANSPNNALVKQQLTCPHCNKTSNKGNIARWHFNNCRLVVTN